MKCCKPRVSRRKPKDSTPFCGSWMNRPRSSREFLCFAKSMQFLTCRANARIPAKSATNCYLFSTSNNKVTYLVFQKYLEKVISMLTLWLPDFIKKHIFNYSHFNSQREKDQERVNKAGAEVTTHVLIPGLCLNSANTDPLSKGTLVALEGLELKRKAFQSHQKMNINLSASM